VSVVWCANADIDASKLLNLLLSGEDPETVVEKIHDYLRSLAEKMRDFAIPVQKYTIFTVSFLASNSTS